MAVKLAVLKSGENVIADIKQYVDDNDKVVSLIFSNPFSVQLLTSELLFEENDSEEYEHKVAFYPWIVLSNDKVIEVDPNWVVCVVEPNEMIKTSYNKKMNSTVQGVKSDEEQIIENFEVLTEEANG